MSAESKSVAGGASSKEGQGIEWRDRSLRSLVQHILEVHHDHTRAEFVRLRGLLDRTVRQYVVAHPELSTVKKLFDELEADMLPHMMREERFLFPYIEKIESTEPGDPSLSAAFGTVENPVRMMMFEHQHDGALLESLRAATDGYTVPRSVSEVYAVLYDGLRRLDADLCEHIFLENKVLFPRAIEAEKSRAR